MKQVDIRTPEEKINSVLELMQMVSPDATNVQMVKYLPGLTDYFIGKVREISELVKDEKWDELDRVPFTKTMAGKLQIINACCRYHGKEKPGAEPKPKKEKPADGDDIKALQQIVQKMYEMQSDQKLANDKLAKALGEYQGQILLAKNDIINELEKVESDLLDAIGRYGNFKLSKQKEIIELLKDMSGKMGGVTAVARQVMEGRR